MPLQLMQARSEQLVITNLSKLYHRTTECEEYWNTAIVEMEAISCIFFRKRLTVEETPPFGNH